MWRLGIDKDSIASRQISLRNVRGILVCFIRGVKVLWTHVTLLGLAWTQILRSAPHLYRLLNFCKEPTQFNKNTLSNTFSVSNGWPNYSGIMLLLKGICLTEVLHREIEEYLLRAMIYHVGNYSEKNFRSDLTSIWMSVSKKWCLSLQLLEMQIFNIEIDVNPD